MNKKFHLEKTETGYILHIKKAEGMIQAIPMTEEEFDNLYAELFHVHFVREDKKLKEMLAA